MESDESAAEAELLQARIGERVPLSGPLRLAPYDAVWPRVFEQEAERVRSALGAGALQLQHVGSTSVPGLSAKPIIDIVLVVDDSADEPAYVPKLEDIGYVLRFREPDWHQHRLLKKARPVVNLHVFSGGCPEIERMLLFRDWLRHDQADRQLYESVKRELIGRDWKFTQDYADAKSSRFITRTWTRIIRAYPGAGAPVGCVARSRSTRLRILPVGFFGSSDTKSIRVGAL